MIYMVRDHPDQIDSGNFSLFSLLDLSAAFDTVDHDILLQRLHLSFGLSSIVQEWMTSYLTGRQQCVRHAGSFSTTTILTCGVLQGSVLGPIHFLLYTIHLIHYSQAWPAWASLRR